MQAFRWIAFTALWMLVCGQAEDSLNPEVQNYQYHYFVRDEDTGDVKSHEEKKIGDTVSGQYTVGEPTGDLRVVKYTADDGGFRANVKYEEGGSPLSEKQSRQSNSKSGYEFQWLPGNPDDIAVGGAEDSREDSESVKESSEDSSEKTIEQHTASTESSGEQETSNVQHDMIGLGQDIAGFDLGTANLDHHTSESSSESSENSSEINSSDETEANAGFPGEKLPDESSSAEIENTELSSQIPTFDSGGVAIEPKEEALSTPESEEKVDSEEGKPSSEGEALFPDSIQTGHETEPEKESDSEEEQQTEEESEAKSDESKEDESAVAAASSPEMAATEPIQMYLPILPFQNPFLNFPMQMGSPQIESNSPTIIYASQNFYNPWQWLGSRRAQDESSVDSSSNIVDNSQYLSSLGYLIMPPRPQ